MNTDRPYTSIQGGYRPAPSPFYLSHLRRRRRQSHSNRTNRSVFAWSMVLLYTAIVTFVVTDMKRLSQYHTTGELLNTLALNATESEAQTEVTRNLVADGNKDNKDKAASNNADAVDIMDGKEEMDGDASKNNKQQAADNNESSEDGFGTINGNEEADEEDESKKGDNEANEDSFDTINRNEEAFDDDEAEKGNNEAIEDGFDIIDGNEEVDEEDEVENQQHCTVWDDNEIDEWWQMNPDWEPKGDNETHTCFAPIANEKKAAFLRKVQTILTSKSCTLSTEEEEEEEEDETTQVLVDGKKDLEATLVQMAKEAWSAMHQPHYQIPILPPEDCSRKSLSSRELLTCSFLPLGGYGGDPDEMVDCDPTVRNDTLFQNTPIDTTEEEEFEPDVKEEKSWIYSYLLRPQRHLRHKIQTRKLLQRQFLKDAGSSCTWMHLPSTEQHPRDLLETYLGASDILTSKNNPNETTPPNVMLLSSDPAMYKEVEAFQEYRWVFPEKWFMKSKRNPVLLLLMKLQLAAHCDTGVYDSTQNDPLDHLLQYAMQFEHGIDNYTLIPVDASSARQFQGGDDGETETPPLAAKEVQGEDDGETETELLAAKKVQGEDDGATETKPLAAKEVSFEVDNGWWAWVIYFAKLLFAGMKLFVKVVRTVLSFLWNEGKPLMERAFAIIGRKMSPGNQLTRSLE